MTSFITNILARHLGTAPVVSPRIAGRFEHDAAPVAAAPDIVATTPKAAAMVTPSVSSEHERSISNQGPAPDDFITARVGNAVTTATIQDSPSPRQTPADNVLRNPETQQRFRSDAGGLFSEQQQPSYWAEERNDSDLLLTRVDSGLHVSDHRLAANASSEYAAIRLFEAPKEPQRSLQSDLSHLQSAAEIPAMPIIPALEAPRPTIKVSIGQIHLRGAAPSTVAQRPQAAQQPRKPALSLDDYLKKRG